MLRAGVVALLLAFAASAEGAMAQTAGDDTFLDAARRDDAAAITAMIAAGQRVDTRDGDGRTALLIATHADALLAAKALVAAGADVNAKDNRQDTPHLYAGAEGRTAILRLLLASGADLRDTNRFGGTALIPAAEKGHAENVRLLIAAGVDVNHVNRLGWTALLEAVILSDGGPVHQEIVADLVRGGADVDIPDGGGVTALQHARSRGFSAIERLLEAAGAR